jgi:hypothetical protein
MNSTQSTIEDATNILDTVQEAYVSQERCLSLRRSLVWGGNQQHAAAVTECRAE